MSLVTHCVSLIQKILKMENDIDLSILLKDCPIGMELDSTNYDGVITFEGISKDCNYPIHIKVRHGNDTYTQRLTKKGQAMLTSYNKCVIFPKDKTTWENFHRPFVDGDIIVLTQNQRKLISIYNTEMSDVGDFKLILCHAILWDKDEGLSLNKDIALYDDCVRFANEKEIETLFAELKANGCEWDSDTKTMKHDTKKFDESKYVAYETRVLVRDLESDNWKPAIYGYKGGSALPYVTLSGYYKYCIPYEGNEHLLGKSDDCTDYFKTWQ